MRRLDPARVAVWSCVVAFVVLFWIGVFATARAIAHDVPISPGHAVPDRAVIGDEPTAHRAAVNAGIEAGRLYAEARGWGDACAGRTVRVLFEDTFSAGYHGWADGVGEERDGSSGCEFTLGEHLRPWEQGNVAMHEYLHLARDDGWHDPDPLGPLAPGSNHQQPLVDRLIRLSLGERMTISLAEARRAVRARHPGWRVRVIDADRAEGFTEGYGAVYVRAAARRGGWRLLREYGAWLDEGRLRISRTLALTTGRGA